MSTLDLYVLDTPPTIHDFDEVDIASLDRLTCEEAKHSCWMPYTSRSKLNTSSGQAPCEPWSKEASVS